MGSIVPEDHVYVTPKRAVTSMADMEKWKKSKAYHEYLGFIKTLNDAVRGKALSCECAKSDEVSGLLDLLDTLDKWIDEIPPQVQAQRFGNKAFRTWFARLQEKAEHLLQAALQPKFHRAVPEIVVYLVEGFGNATRIDYGTGHEMAFLMLLCCLFKIGAFVETDTVAVVTCVFNRYLTLVRKLQLTYRMEPAGSHGVWSLDDYQFVPFIWGSSQLIDHPQIEPKSFLVNEVVEAYCNDYLFLGCIKFINQVKTGLFAEHSNQLWNISDVPSWSKINSGLIRMYIAEVLEKFPVVQHVLFGSLMSIEAAPSSHFSERSMGSMRPRPPDSFRAPPPPPKN